MFFTLFLIYISQILKLFPISLSRVTIEYPINILTIFPGYISSLKIFIWSYFLERYEIYKKKIYLTVDLLNLFYWSLNGNFFQSASIFPSILRNFLKDFFDHFLHYIFSVPSNSTPLIQKYISSGMIILFNYILSLIFLYFIFYLQDILLVMFPNILALTIYIIFAVYCI